MFCNDKHVKKWNKDSYKINPPQNTKKKQQPQTYTVQLQYKGHNSGGIEGFM